MQLKKGKQASYIRGVQIKEVSKKIPEVSGKTFSTGQQGYRKFSLKKQAFSHAKRAEKRSGRNIIPANGSHANIHGKESRAARTEEGKKYTTGMEDAVEKNKLYRHEDSKDTRKETEGFRRKEQGRQMVLEQHEKKYKPSFVVKHGDIKLQEKVAGTSYKAVVSHCQKETWLSSTGKDKIQNFGRRTGIVNQDQPTDIRYFPLALVAKTENAKVPDRDNHEKKGAAGRFSKGTLQKEEVKKTDAQRLETGMDDGNAYSSNLHKMQSFYSKTGDGGNFVNLPKKQLSYVKNPKISFPVMPVYAQTATREKTPEESGDKEELVQYKGNRGIPKTAMVSAVLLSAKRKNVIKGKAEKKEQAFSPGGELSDAAKANRSSGYQKFHIKKKKRNVSGYIVKGTHAVGHIAEKAAVTASNVCYTAQKTTELMKQEELIPGLLMMDTAGLEGKAVAFLAKKGGKLAVSAVKSRSIKRAERGKEKCAKEKEAGQAKTLKEADTTEKMKPDMQHMTKTGTHAGQGQRNSLNSNELLIQKDKYHIVDAHYETGLSGAGPERRSLEDKYHISREKTEHDPRQDICSDAELTEKKAKAVKEKRETHGKKKKVKKHHQKDPAVADLKKKFMIELLTNPENGDAESGIGRLVCQIAQMKAERLLVLGARKLLGLLAAGAVSLFSSLLPILFIPLLVVLLVFGTCAGAMAYLLNGGDSRNMPGQFLPNAAAECFSESITELYQKTVLYRDLYNFESLYYKVDGESAPDAAELMEHWNGTEAQVSMLGTNFSDVIMLYLVKSGAAENQGGFFLTVGTEAQRQLLKRCYETLNNYHTWQKFRYETNLETGEQNLIVSIDVSVTVWHLAEYLEQNPDYFTKEELEQYHVLCEIFAESSSENSENELVLENYITFAKLDE